MLLLNVTTYERKNGFLLIEVFRNRFNPQNDGHLEQFRVAIYSFYFFVDIPDNNSKILITEHQFFIFTS